MAVERVLNPIGMKAAADLSAKQFYIVEITAADTVNVCSAATDVPFGVLQNDPKSGETAEIAYADGEITKVVSDGSTTAIAIGDQVGTDASGKAVKKTISGELVLGRALEASSADGVIITIVIEKGHVA